MGHLGFAGILILIALSAVSPASALDDRDAASRTRNEVVEAIRETGFDDWDYIEFDNGVWKIANARHWGRRRYDLKVDPSTQLIIKTARDNKR